MRISSAVVVLALLCASNLHAVNVSGTISANTTWNAAAGTYALFGTVTVAAGCTLVVEPGVTITNHDGPEISGLTIGGTLYAIGTPSQPIRFTRSVTAQRDLGSTRATTGGEIILDWCEFDRAEGVGGINASFIIRHCTFVGPLTQGGGIYMISPSSAPLVRACTITGSRGAALDLIGVTTGTFDSLTITMDAALDTPAVRLTSSSPTISNAVITSSGLRPAVWISGSSRPIIEYSIIDGGAQAAVWCDASGDIPVIRGDSLRTTGALLCRLPIASWTRATGAAANRVHAPGASVDILGSSSGITGSIPALVPLRIRGNITLTSGATLTIDPGVTMLGGGGSGYTITVEGALIARGTESSRVTFTRGSAAPEDILGAITLNPGARGTFEWCDFSYTGGVVFAGAYCNITRCHFLNGGGLVVAMPPENPVIRTCSFDSVTGDAVSLYTVGAAAIDSLDIRGSTGSGILLDDASPVIRYSTISGSGAHGVLCQNGSNPVITSDLIFGNALYGVRNETTTLTVDARLNWWGSASGPFHATQNATGEGDSVSDYVQFAPWIGSVGYELPQRACAVRAEEFSIKIRGTTLTLSIPQNSFVSFALFDIAGRALGGGYGRGALRAGSHVFNLGGLAPGLYTAVVDSDGVRRTAAVQVR